MLKVIAYGLQLTALGGVAALEQLALPVTPEVASVSPFLNPLSVARKLGLASPYSRLALGAVTVRCAFVIVSWPVTKAGKSLFPAAGAPTAQVIADGLPLTALAGVAVVEHRAPAAPPEATSAPPFYPPQLV